MGFLLRSSLALLVTFALFPSLAAADEAGEGKPEVISARPIAELLAEVPLIDGHNDLVIHYVDWEKWALKPADAYDISGPTTGQSDIPRMRQGSLGAAIFTIWTADDNAPESGLESSIALFRQLAARNPSDLAIVTTPGELVAAHAGGMIGVMLGLEGGDPVQGDLSRLAWMKERGVAEMGLVWSSNGIGTAGRASASESGLTELGRDVVREMNRLGLIIDLSHASPRTVMDVAAITSAPVIDTHAIVGTFGSGGRTLGYGDTALADEAMLAIAKTGGVVMPMFMPDAIDAEYRAWIDRRNDELAKVATRVFGAEEAKGVIDFLPWPDAVEPDMQAWLDANPPPTIEISGIADVYDRVRNVVGIDHIGIGSDFDGMGFNTSSWHPGLKDVSQLPLLFEELRVRGWSDDDLQKLAGKNFIRTWEAILANAAAAED